MIIPYIVNYSYNVYAHRCLFYYLKHIEKHKYRPTHLNKFTVTDCNTSTWTLHHNDNHCHIMGICIMRKANPIGFDVFAKVKLSNSNQSISFILNFKYFSAILETI